MRVRHALKRPLTRSGRVLMGPGRGLHLAGPSSARIFLGIYEFEVNSWIRTLAERGVRTFDVGAQYGLESLVFARLTGAEVLAVDADADVGEFLSVNIARNGLTRLVQPLSAFVGDGTAGTVTLDALAEEYFLPDFIKLDIEGGEATALSASPKLLELCDRWLIETHSLEAENECLQLLASHGLRIEIQNQRTWLRDYRPIEHNRWLIARR